MVPSPGLVRCQVGHCNRFSEGPRNQRRPRSNSLVKHSIYRTVFRFHRQNNSMHVSGIDTLSYYRFQNDKTLRKRGYTVKVPHNVGISLRRTLGTPTRTIRVHRTLSVDGTPQPYLYRDGGTPRRLSLSL